MMTYKQSLALQPVQKKPRIITAAVEWVNVVHGLQLFKHKKPIPLVGNLDKMHSNNNSAQ
jgi:hypothetical protein